VTAEGPGSRRTRLVVLFGGRSAEHEVSCVSARHVLAAADPDPSDVVPIGIPREGQWVLAEGARAALVASGPKALPAALEVAGPLVDPDEALAQPDVVVFPLLHGPFGEDGTVQGLLELAGVPYVGAGVLGSALGMDKAMAKQVLGHAGLPQARHLVLRDDHPVPDPGLALGWPVFVKPANLGSSVGVTKVHGLEELGPALEAAFSYDEWAIVEEAVVGREIEVAVLGNREPEASVPGEVRPSHDFYDYEDKYVVDGAELLVPAPLAPEAADEARRLAVEAFRALRLDGMARVDFFYEEGGRGWLVNEVNTIPGFTPISMYPRLWEATGVPYSKLVDRLVELAVERHRRRAGRVGRGRDAGGSPTGAPPGT
jgi:D-alanine-D-alanine ligase